MFNTKVPFASVPDRGLFLLQAHDIKYTFNEMITIQTHDGLYDEANKAYYVSYNEDGKMRTNLPFIVHQADIIASRIEWQHWKHASHNSDDSSKLVRGSSAVQKRMNTLATAPKSESASKIFDELFKK